MTEWIISSSFLILVILGLRMLFRKKISRRMQYALWGIVLIRLLLPFQFGESLFSIQNLSLQNGIRHRITVENSIQNSKQSQQNRTHLISEPSNVSYIKNADHPLTSLSDNSAGSSPVQNLQSISKESFFKFLGKIWLLGFLLALVWILTANLYFYMRLRKNRKIYVFDACPLTVYVTDQVISPCLFGLRSPAIYLTEKATEDECHIEYVIAHELCHYGHLDHFWLFLKGICLAVWWWNPLVWAAAIYSRRDCELACDEACINQLGEENRISYGETIINMIGSSKHSYIFSGSTVMISEKNGIKYRLKMLVKNPKTLRPAAGVVLLAALAGILLSFTGAKADFALKNPSSLPVNKEFDENSDILSKDGEPEKSEILSEVRESLTQETDITTAEAQATVPSEIDATPKTEEENTHLFENWIKGGTGRVVARSISKSSRVLDRYMIAVPEFWEYDYYDEKGLFFADDCEFYINYEIGQLEYTPVSFDLFAETIGSHEFDGKACNIEFKDGEIMKAYLIDPYDGISYNDHSPYDSTSYALHGLESLDLVSTYEAELNGVEGLETIKVYAGNMGDGDMGYVIVENTDGELLYVGFAHDARACWNSIYLGEVDGEAYLFTLNPENRELFGCDSYQAFRLDENGSVKLLNGASYEYDKDTYDENRFFKWADPMNYYLKNSFLLLSTQDCELRYSPDRDLEKYEKNALNEELQLYFKP